MTRIVRVVLISIVTLTWLSTAHADGLSSWTIEISKVSQGIIERVSPDRTLTAAMGPSAIRDGRSATAHLNDFIARQYRSVSALTSAAFGVPFVEGHGGTFENDGNAKGTYVIDGYFITLSFDSGRTLQTFFATDPSGNTVLGNTYYWTS